MIEWTDTPPVPDAYVVPRAATGLGPRSLASARIALPATVPAVCARDGDRLVAMGRVVGDGGCFAMLTDIAVLPDRQVSGLGTDVTARLVAWCEANLPPACHLFRVSSERAAPLHARHGFRPTRGMDRYADPTRSSPP